MVTVTETAQCRAYIFIREVEGIRHGFTQYGGRKLISRFVPSFVGTGLIFLSMIKLHLVFKKTAFRGPGPLVLFGYSSKRLIDDY